MSIKQIWNSLSWETLLNLPPTELLALVVLGLVVLGVTIYGLIMAVMIVNSSGR